jgi:hypothetical protein
MQSNLQHFDTSKDGTHSILANVVIVVEKVRNVALKAQGNVSTHTSSFQTILQLRRVFKQLSCILCSIDDAFVDATFCCAVLKMKSQQIATTNAWIKIIYTIPNDPSATPSSNLYKNVISRMLLSTSICIRHGRISEWVENSAAKE